MSIVTVFPEGGTPGYEYQVLDAGSTSVIRDWTSIEPADTFMLPDGTYIIKMRDDDECPAVAVECDETQPLATVRSSAEVASEFEILLEAQCCRIVCNDKGWFHCDDEEGIENWLENEAFTLEGNCEGLTVKNNFKWKKDCGKYTVTFTVVNEDTGEPDLDDDGNRKTCTNTLIIKDKKPPVIIVKPVKKIWCDEKPKFDVPRIYDNCDDDVDVKVYTKWYYNEYGHCVHKRTWVATDNCGNKCYASQVIKIIDKTPPKLVPVHPLLKHLKSGDTLYAECDNPPFFQPDDFKVVYDCSKCPQHYKIKMDDYVKYHDCKYGKAIKEVVCWWYVYDEYTKKYIRYYIYIFIVDRTPPEFISIPDDKTIACDDPVKFGKVVVKDNCSSKVHLSHKDEWDVSEDGQSTITRIWTATDGCGNSSTASQTLTLAGSGPVFTSVPQDKRVPAGTDIEFGEPVVSSACGEVTVMQDGDDKVLGNTCDGLIYIRTWKATTDNGLKAKASQTILVKPDKEAPVFSRKPGDVVIPCGSEIPSFDIMVTDNTDDGVTIETEIATEGEGCDQVITRTWTATDACEISATISQKISFSDQLPITFTYVPGDLELRLGDTIPDDVARAETDCTEGGLSVSAENVVVKDSTCSRIIQRLFIASDDCGNKDTAVQVITMIDTVAPELITVISDKSIEWGDSLVFDTPEFEDNVGIQSIVTKDLVEERQCEGSVYKRIWTVTDSCGNTTEVSQTITILPDEQAPVFPVTDSVTIIGCQDTLPEFTPVATDNCGGAVTLTIEEETTGGGCEETTVRKWTATDKCGNSSTFRWVISRQDTTPPVFDHTPEDYTVTCIEDVVFDTLTAADECGGVAEVAYVDLHREGDCFTGYEMTRMWSATDSCGNMAQIAQNIFVQGDTLAPVITEVPADTILQCGDSIPDQTVEVADNCGVDTMWIQVHIRPEGEEDCADSTGYYYIRNWIASDQCGNRDTARQYIAVLGEGQDHLMTFVEVPPTKVVSCEEDVVFGTPVVKSTCDSISISVEDFVTGELCSPEYKLVREWTATDTCGQSVSTYQTIIVQQDTLAPRLSLAHPAKFMGCAGNADSLTFDQPAVWDECAAELVSTADTTITEDADADSLKIRTWTYTDACGNESSISQKLVFGIMDPDDIFRNKSDTFRLTCVNELDDYRPVAYSCDSVVAGFEDVMTDSTCANQLTVVRTWIAADTSGNTDTLVQVFYIHDTIPPAIVLATDTMYMTSLEYSTNGAGSNIVSITDNCGEATGDIIIVKKEDDGEVRYEYEVAMGDECTNVTIRRFVVIIAERPPVVNVSLVKSQAVATVNGGIRPFDYKWSYLKPGSHTWIQTDDHDKTMNLEGMGFLEKVKVRVTDAQEMSDEDVLDLLVAKNVSRNITLHPNPASDYVEVRLEMEDVSRIELFNVWGQRVKVYEYDKLDRQSRVQLDLRDVPQGSYSLRFVNARTVYTRRLIKVE